MADEGMFRGKAIIMRKWAGAVALAVSIFICGMALGKDSIDYQADSAKADAQLHCAAVAWMASKSYEYDALLSLGLELARQYIEATRGGKMAPGDAYTPDAIIDYMPDQSVEFVLGMNWSTIYDEEHRSLGFSPDQASAAFKERNCAFLM